MTGPRPSRTHRAEAATRDPDRAVSPVVGVVLLVALTALLSSVALATVGFDRARLQSTPQAHLSAELSATDGWPDGQRLRLVHEAGDTLAVADLAVVVEFDAVDAQTRVREFPTRRLTGDHVRGPTLFDRTYAGVDGELDAAHTDGQWESGETASLRVAQRAYDVRPDDRAVVRVVHRPTGAGIAEIEVVAS